MFYPQFHLKLVIRLCFEWGAIVKGDLATTIFIRSAPAKSGDSIHIGTRQPSPQMGMWAVKCGFCAFVESITINPRGVPYEPGRKRTAFELAEQFEGDGLSGSGSTGLGLTCALRGCTTRRFSILIKWRAELEMVPLDIHYQFGPCSPSELLLSRLVVQLCGSESAWDRLVHYPPAP